jgi:hypothetical protein
VVAAILGGSDFRSSGAELANDRSAAGQKACAHASLHAECPQPLRLMRLLFPVVAYVQDGGGSTATLRSE